MTEARALKVSYNSVFIMLSGVAGALWLAVCYYGGAVMDTRMDNRKAARYARIVFLRAAIPAFFTPFLGVRMMERALEFTAGDMWWSMPMGFLGGYMSSAVIKKFAKMVSIEEKDAEGEKD